MGRRDDSTAGLRSLGARGRSIRAIERVVAFLHHRDSVLREESVRAILRIGARMGGDALARAIEVARIALRDDEMLVRNAVAEESGALRSSVVADLLIELLRDDASWIIRCSAAESLGDHPSSRARSALRRTLRDDDYAPVRSYAALSLGRIGTRADLAALRRASRPAEDESVRIEAAGVRARLGESSALDELLRAMERAVENNVLVVLEDLVDRDVPNGLLRRRAALLRALALVGDGFVARRIARKLRRLSPRGRGPS